MKKKGKSRSVACILQSLENKNLTQKEFKVLGKLMVLDNEFYENLRFVVEEIGWNSLVHSREGKMARRTILDLAQELRERKESANKEIENG